ncbi:MAG TPA: ATP-binding protein, partial [Chitinophagales bacterium]|nr:ATP-binding protein [Chitinophagales bacterium]
MSEDNQLIIQLRELIASSSVYRKRIEVDLFRSEEKYRLLLDQLSDAIYLSTIDGKFETFNKATSDLLGYSAEELKTLDVLKIYANPADREVFTKHIRNKKEVRDYEVQLRHKDGHLIDCLVSSSVKYGDEGVVLGFQGIIRDITLHKKTEELERAKLLAERANKFKAEFLANMSHEIRTPLNAIVGMVHLLDQTNLNEKQKEFLRAIKTSSGSLLEIINDILDFSKIESGKIELEEKSFSIRNSVKELISTIRYKADEKGLDLLVNIDDNIPSTVAGDPLRLNQILLNLLSNAIKFTQQGEVRLTIKLIEILGDKARIFFSVRDTGIGIVPEKLSTIFESFTQATSDTTRLYGGTGLGLAIVKKLIDMLNGAIMVKSRIDEGSEFIFEIDFKMVGEITAIEERNQFDMVDL